jgi:hypothetical protein
MVHILYAFLVVVAGSALVAWGLCRLPRGRLRTAGLTGLVVVDAAAATLLVLELGMALFFAQSDGFNLTRSSQNWFARYWKPINSLGYRDMEPRAKDSGQKLLVVLGDSFASGHGIDRVEDRFGDILGRDLGPGWRVANVAKIGWDTVDEDKALRSFPLTPDVVVLAYFVNDIIPAAKAHHADLQFPIRFPTGLTKYLVDHFALANFVYWRLARTGNMEGAGQRFWTGLASAYADPVIWKEHADQLDSIVNWCHEHGARLVALVIPNLADVSGSAAMTGKVAGFFRERGVTTLDLTGLLAGRKPSDLVVNAVDSHANVRLNAEIAVLLRRAILEDRSSGNAAK